MLPTGAQWDEPHERQRCAVVRRAYDHDSEPVETGPEPLDLRGSVLRTMVTAAPSTSGWSCFNTVIRMPGSFFPENERRACVDDC
jgi:hypothetical protein